MALSKPSGLLSQADASGDSDVVTCARSYIKAKYNRPGNVFVGLVHRLDRPVSGAMVLARTSKAARRMSAAFRERRVIKEYWAVVEGRLTGSGVMEDRLVTIRRMARVTGDPTAGQSASLHWEADEAHRGITAVRIRLITGRRHQIRCQFAHRGMPIVGDLHYGATRSVPGREIALHARKLMLDHPVAREPLQIVAPLPHSWRHFAPLWQNSS